MSEAAVQDAALARDAGPMTTDDERMRFAIALSAGNVEHDTGGPFGAAVFESDTGRVVSAGVNLVIPGGASILHAETVALTLAQRALGTHDLASAGDYELVTSCEPCAMCLGAIPWSGVRRLVCGAIEADARLAGFDEGVKPQPWTAALDHADIEVRTQVLRDEAVAVLRDYAASGKPVY